jgi:hypothetical protein
MLKMHYIIGTSWKSMVSESASSEESNYSHYRFKKEFPRFTTGLVITIGALRGIHELLQYLTAHFLNLLSRFMNIYLAYTSSDEMARSIEACVNSSIKDVER